MNTKEENVLVKLVKKSVGLPTAGSGCCGPVPATAEKKCCETEASESTSSGCGCGNESAQAQDEQPPAQA